MFTKDQFCSINVKYKVVLDINKSKVLSVVGPMKASEYDMNVFVSKQRLEFCKWLAAKQAAKDSDAMDTDWCRNHVICHPHFN